jgi:hypothetical protein
MRRLLRSAQQSVVKAITGLGPFNLVTAALSHRRRHAGPSRSSRCRPPWSVRRSRQWPSWRPLLAILDLGAILGAILDTIVTDRTVRADRPAATRGA